MSCSPRPAGAGKHFNDELQALRTVEPGSIAPGTPVGATNHRIADGTAGSWWPCLVWFGGGRDGPGVWRLRLFCGGQSWCCHVGVEWAPVTLHMSSALLIQAISVCLVRGQHQISNSPLGHERLKLLEPQIYTYLFVIYILLPPKRHPAL